MTGVSFTPGASSDDSKKRRWMNWFVNRLRFFWTRIWGKTCVWKRS
ncbi:MAG: hypothetical protein VB143_06490 [Burkholderia sp.]